MQKLIVIIIIIISFFVVSCNGQQKVGMTEMQKDLKKEYFDAKIKIDKKYTSHFPNDLIIDSSFFLTTNSENKILILENRVIDIKSIEKLIPQAKAIYNSTDSCQLILDRFNTNQYFDLTKLTDYDKSLIDRPCYKDKLPIPNFRDSKFADDSTGLLLPGFTIYVLEAKQGMYYKPDPEYEPNTYMPQYWNHGYSKGFALNYKKDIVIYWIVIW